MDVTYSQTEAGNKENKLHLDIIQNSTVRAFLSGSASATFYSVLLQPLDVIKTRLQNPSVALKSTKRGKSQIIQVLSDVVKQESLKGLWKGTTPSLVRTVPGVGLYFSLLTNIRAHVFKDKPLNPTESIFVGAAARSLAGAILMPVTVVKTRIESGVYRYTGVLSALRDISKNEGIKGLTRGIVPTIVRDAPFAGLYFMIYTQAKTLAPKDIYVAYPSPVHFCCAIIASTLASFVTQPPDVFKTQLQLHPNKFSGLRAVIVHVYVQHGFPGYFQGILPRLFRRTLVSAISWTVYEKVMQTTKIKY